MAKEMHPDVRPNDKEAEATFKRATAAFNLLSDSSTKARFDRGEIDADGNERMAFRGGPGAGGARGGGTRYYSTGGGYGGGAGGPGYEQPFDIGDIFSDLFGGGAGMGGGQRGPSRARGRDVRFTLDVDFVDAITGAKRRVSLAEGKVLDLTIPPGVVSGQVLRLKGQGKPGMNGGPAGDALVETQVKPHPYFRREGQDVHMDLNISLTEAVEGGKVQAPTVTGPVSLTIPAGSNTGAVLRLKGKGVGGVGDQFVRLVVLLPDSIDDDLKKFVKKWSKRDYTPQRPS